MCGGQPDRAPMPLRMRKVLRKRQDDSASPPVRALRVQEEFAVAVCFPVVEVFCPCSAPMGSWPGDVAVALRHEVLGNKVLWQRTIRTPQGDRHAIKEPLVAR